MYIHVCIYIHTYVYPFCIYTHKHVNTCVYVHSADLQCRISIFSWQIPFVLRFAKSRKSDATNLLHVATCVAVCCSVLQCVAVCCSMLQHVAVCCSVLQCVAVWLRYFFEGFAKRRKIDSKNVDSTGMVQQMLMQQVWSGFD